MSTDESRLAQLLAELCFYLIKQGDHERARVMLQGLKELRPQHPTPHILEGLFHFGRLDYPAAERSYRSGLEQEPANDLAKAFLAESLIPQRRYREAEKLLEEVIGRGADASAVALAQGLNEGLRQGLFQRA
ncbi:MAG TPA: tetratricopeptide repeat protein [Thermoanaerobaculia bacterium]|nr:tetratricopeptide repeat protein [Thermoanaerobaculia bacterium]